MKHYKALILDLDGTTIASRGGSLASKLVEQAIKAAHPVIKVAIATGRSWHLAIDVIQQLGITEPCIFDGGAQIVSPTTGKVHFNKLLSIRKQQEIIALCLPLKYTIYITSKHQVSQVKRIEDAVEFTGKVELENVPTNEASCTLEKLKTLKGVAAHIASSWNPGDFVAIHMTHQEATKEHAIAELLKIMGVTPADTIGVGDTYNDLPLFASVGLKVAMGNSPDELKSAADYVAPDLEHDGVANVIRKFILPTR